MPGNSVACYNLNLDLFAFLNQWWSKISIVHMQDLILNNNILNCQYHWHGKHWTGFEIFWSQIPHRCDIHMYVHVTSVEQTSVLCVIFIIFWKRSRQLLTVGTCKVESTMYIRVFRLGAKLLNRLAVRIIQPGFTITRKFFSLKKLQKKFFLPM